MLADLGAVSLDRPPGPVVARQVRRVGLHRPGPELHRIRVQLAAVPGETPAPAVEPEQQRERELGIAMLDGHQAGLVLAQRSQRVT
jgi:hypothetical protein